MLQMLSLFNAGNKKARDTDGKMKPIEDKSNQWFGVSLSSSGVDGTVLVGSFHFLLILKCAVLYCSTMIKTV